jgi:hypothetical protein
MCFDQLLSFVTNIPLNLQTLFGLKKNFKNPHNIFRKAKKQLSPYFNYKYYAPQT